MMIKLKGKYAFYRVKKENGEPGEYEGNCLAVLLNDSGQPEKADPNGNYACIAAVLFTDNSPCTYDGVSPLYLKERCFKIDQHIAEDVHPKLFEYLLYMEKE